MTHDELLAKITAEFYSDNTVGKKHINQHFALRAVVELPNELVIERVSDELTAIGQSDESFMSGYKYAMHLVIQAIEKELK